MKEIPILFSTAMVQAILEGRKSQTRRIMKPQIKDCDHSGFVEADWKGKPIQWSEIALKQGRAYCGCCGNGVEYSNDFGGIKCPYGKPGDVLWLRECWRSMGFDGDNNSMLFEFKDGASHWVTMPKDYKLFAHMPKEAARIWLQVTDVRVERLQDISEADAIAEGVQPNCAGVDKCPSQYCQRMGCQCTGEYYHYQRDLDDFPAYSAKESFESLWQSINGVDSWGANPFVWVVKFTVLSTTGKADLNNLQKQ